MGQPALFAELAAADEPPLSPLPSLLETAIAVAVVTTAMLGCPGLPRCYHQHAEEAA